MGLILLCYTCATASVTSVCREERKRQNSGVIEEIRNARYWLRDYLRKWEQGIRGEKGLEPKHWPCLGRQSLVFSALLLINPLPSCLLQAALPHLLGNVLVKNYSASRFHPWKCLPGLALWLPSFPRHQACFAGNGSTASVPSLSAWVLLKSNEGKHYVRD